MMHPIPEWHDGHLRVTGGEEYAEEWRGLFVIEMCGPWHGFRLTYARPDFMESGMGRLGKLFPTREAAEAALQRETAR